MNFSHKGKLAAGCNWAMAITAVGFSGYVFVQLFSVPPQSAVARISIPIPAAAPAKLGAPAAVASVPARAVAPPAATTPTPAPVAAQSRTESPAAASAAAERRRLETQWGGPIRTAPAVPIPALNPHTLPPGVGKDF